MLEKQADRLDALDDSTDYFEYLKKADGLNSFIYNLTDDVLGSPEVAASLKSLRITNNIPQKADDLTALRYIVRMNPDSPKVHSFFNKASEEMFKDIDKEIENVSEIKRVVSSDKDPEEFIKYLIDEATSLGIYWSYGDGYAYDADKNHKYRYTFIADVTPDMVDIKKTRLASLTFNRNEQEIRLKKGVPVTLKGLLCDGVSIDIPSELLNKTFISEGVSTMGFTFFGLNKAAKFFRKKSDLGIGNFGVDSNSLSPNTHNQAVYYTDDCWSKNDGKLSNTWQPGSNGEGEHSLDNRNPQIMQPNRSGTPFDKADRAKQFALPHGNEKTVQPDDAEEIIDTVKWSVANAGFTLNKTARIVKDKNKYRILSEKGKSLGEYPTKEKAEKRLKQIEMFKHMDKKADYFDWKGHQNTTEQLGAPEKIVPEDAHRVKPISVPETPTSSQNIPGYNQDDGALANPDAVEVKANAESGAVVQKDLNPSVKEKVTQNVKQPLTSGSFDGSRGARGARGSFFAFTGVNKEAATPINCVPHDKVAPQDASRNEPTPFDADNKLATSYSKEELQKLQPEIENQKIIFPTSKDDYNTRMFAIDNEMLGEQTEMLTPDFFNGPTNQNVNHDSMTSAEKKEEKERSTNKIY